jgi:CDP-glycerol glycerophosphotransferase (TagB/SpsB family)
MTLETAANPIKVVFLTFYYEAWDSLADIHQLMSSDPRFEVTVISIPRRFTMDSPYGEEELVSDFFTRSGIKHLSFNYEDSLQGLAEIKELNPDYVFLNYPWQRNYQPGYRVELLSEFTKVCYVPYYSAPLVIEPGEDKVASHWFEQRSHQLASLIFTQDENVRDAYFLTSRGNSHVYLTGTPKLDALTRQVLEGEKRWPLGQSNNFRIVWAPHHSYSPNWLNFGTFVEIFEDMLAFATQHRGVDFVLRPHPLMFSTLSTQKVIKDEVLDKWLQAWDALPNTATDANGEIAQLFAAADLFVTDGISFLAEYPLATGKPALFMEKVDHWPLSPLGELAALANMKVTTFQDFVSVYEVTVADGLPDYSEAIDNLRKVAQPYPGQAAQRILNIVYQDFEDRTPLVDKTLITEIPWESRPGTEPAWD